MSNLFTPHLDIDFLYNIADCDGDGVIGINDSLQFFQYTKLPQNILSIIWSLSVPHNKPMKKEHFIVALRYVAFAQKGKKVDKSLLNGSPPYTAPEIKCPFVVSSMILNRISHSFEKMVTPEEPYVTRNQLFNLIIKSKCVIDTDEIIKLCNPKKENSLDRVGFAEAMVLIDHYNSYNILPKRIPVYFTQFLRKRFNDKTVPSIQNAELIKSKTIPLSSKSETNTPKQRKSTSSLKVEFRKSSTTSDSSFRTLHSKSNQSPRNTPRSQTKSEIVYQNFSPVLSESNSSYELSRRQSLVNIETEVDWPTYSFSENSTPSLDESIQEYEPLFESKSLIKINNILSKLITRKEQLLNEIEVLQYQVNESLNELSLSHFEQEEEETDSTESLPEI